MNQLTNDIVALDADISLACTQVGLRQLVDEIETLRDQPLSPGFWDNNLKAQAITKRQAKLQARAEPWLALQTQVKDLVELARLEDDSLATELTKQYQHVAAEFKDLKTELTFAGEYDDFDVILSIYAGAGGTDAQDWAAMLLRMYVRWAEKSRLEITTIDRSEGEEAGLKSVTVEFSGKLAYGKLKGEHGVHRLVRLSPFNSDSLRQTSFAKVDILPKIDSPDQMEIDERELKIDVYRAGGHGGQSVNTTDSAVRITHVPTGITVAIQNERSQLQNKEVAMTILRSKLAQLRIEQHQEKVALLKGPNQSAEWGNQIRSYVLHPYTMVKDLRTRHETSDVTSVLDGNLDPFITAYLEQNIGK